MFTGVVLCHPLGTCGRSVTLLLLPDLGQDGLPLLSQLLQCHCFPEAMVFELYLRNMHNLNYISGKSQDFSEVGMNFGEVTAILSPSKKSKLNIVAKIMDLGSEPMDLNPNSPMQ